MSSGDHPPVAPAPPGPARSWSTGRVLGAVLASLLLFVSLGALLAGAGIRIADSLARDDAGFVTGTPTPFTSPGHAATSGSVAFGFGRWPDLPREWLGEVKVTADPLSRRGVFVGLAPTRAANRYLAGVARTEDRGLGNARRHFHDGGAPRVAPTDVHFWVASAFGTGRQSFTWQPRSGTWTLVVMEPRGTAPMGADVSVGARLPVLGDLSLGLLVGGSVLFVAGAGVLVAVLARRRTTPSGPAG